MHRPGHLLPQKRVHRPLTLDPRLTLEGVGHHRQIEVAFAAGLGVHPALMMVTGVSPTVVLDLQTPRIQPRRQFFTDFRGDWAFRHTLVLVGDQFDPTLRSMSSAFQYTPRFKDMRIKPPKPEEEAAEADVLHLKPGEKPCHWPDCRQAATARAPKSRERLNDFYDFCQRHAGEYNKGWNFYAGMNEAQVRAAQENEAMTGGRPTWEMKAGKNTREAAAFAAKMGTAN